MNPDYVKEVRRFGSSAPFKDEDGKSSNLSHDDDIDPSLVQMDGTGNVDSVPLVWRKPCFGRPERFARNGMGGTPWRDDNGVRRPGKTTCDTCLEKSPGTFKACDLIVSERIASDPAINAAFDEWLDACADYGPACFVGSRMKLWERFIQTIIEHGGWLSVNDEQVKLEALRVKQERIDRRKANRQARARRQRAARLGLTARPVTQEYLDKLEAERDRRSAQLKRLGKLSGRTKRDMLWLKMLDDNGCDRIAEVWRTRELLSRLALTPTGQAIAERMDATGRWPLTLPSLRARVYDDLKRLAKLEDDTAGAPLWPKWTFS